MGNSGGWLVLGGVLIVGGMVGIKVGNLGGEDLLLALIIPAAGVVSLGVGLYSILRGH